MSLADLGVIAVALRASYHKRRKDARSEMMFELKRVDDIPECCQVVRDESARASFCRDEDFPDVKFIMTKWPTCVGETTVAIYRPKNDQAVLPAYLYLHGGGWCTNDLKFLDDYCRKVVQNTGFCVISPDYHLAPENPFPGLFYECYDIANYMKEHADELKIRGDGFAVGGDSAGGNLSAALCIHAVEQNVSLFCAHLMYYPMTDMTRRSIDRRDPDPSPRNLPGFGDFAIRAYAGECDKTDPLLSPLFLSADTAKKMPPLFMLTSYLDGLCEEGEEYAIKLQKNGVTVTMRRQLCGTHGTLNRKNWGYDETMQLTYRYLKAVLRD